MSPEELLNQAMEAIEKRGITGSGQYHICYYEGKIQCLSTTAMVEQGLVFGTYANHNLTEGLTTKQWDQLSNNIAGF